MPLFSKDPSALGVQNANTSKDVAWFVKSISPRLKSPALVELLEKYAGIPAEEQEKHLHEVVRIPSSHMCHPLPTPTQIFA
jgi:hypothetical protein